MGNLRKFPHLKKQHKYGCIDTGNLYYSTLMSYCKGHDL